MEFAIGTVGAIGGIIVAVVLFALSWWMVVRARAGNAKVREVRHDPHLDATRHGEDADDPQRNIPQ
ncbi:MAG TPA: hypothetical protein VMR74_05745 [Gammaproteobacteria bacterium]|nr:hypothetical protein [Gammaproteobacteria bacterium]